MASKLIHPNLAPEHTVVSVVIPAFNAEHTLARTLESVLGQTHPALQVLVVDDGSTDGTAEVARAFERRDRRVHMLTQHNGGVARARNLGLQHAQADFVAFLDADDLWHPRKIERQLASLLANPAAGFVYAPYRVIDDHDEVVASGCFFTVRGRVLFRHLLVNFVGNGSSMLVRRQAAIEVGGFAADLRDRGLEGAEDYLLQLQLAARHEVEVVPEYLVGYRRSAASMSSNVARMLAAELAVRQRVLGEVGFVPECIYRWGAAARLSDGMLRSLRRKQFRQAGVMLKDALNMDAVGALAQLMIQMRLRGLDTWQRHVQAQRPPQHRQFMNYDPLDGPLEPVPLFLAHRLQALRDTEREHSQEPWHEAPPRGATELSVGV